MVAYSLSPMKLPTMLAFVMVRTFTEAKQLRMTLPCWCPAKPPATPETDPGSSAPMDTVPLALHPSNQAWPAYPAKPPVPPVPVTCTSTWQSTSSALPVPPTIVPPTIPPTSDFPLTSPETVQWYIRPEKLPAKPPTPLSPRMDRSLRWRF